MELNDKKIILLLEYFLENFIAFIAILVVILFKKNILGIIFFSMLLIIILKFIFFKLLKEVERYVKK